jgi:hypothetical protein
MHVQTGQQHGAPDLRRHGHYSEFSCGRIDPRGHHRMIRHVVQEVDRDLIFPPDRNFTTPLAE